MIRWKHLWIIILAVAGSYIGRAQEQVQNILEKENQDMLKKYLEMKTYEKDPDASALIIFNKGECVLNPNAGATYFERERLVKVLNKDGLTEADFVFTEDMDNDVRKVSAITYNLENDTVVTQSIDKSDVVRDKLVDGLAIYKFNVPNVKVGTIIYIRYNVERANNITLPRWYFQEEYPVLYSSFRFSLPGWIKYDASERTDVLFSEVKKQELQSCSNCRYLGGTGRDHVTTWVKRDIPAFKSEPFMLDDVNYLMGIKLRMTHKNGVLLDHSWEYLTKKLFEGMDNIISQSYSPPTVVKQKAMDLTKEVTDDTEKAKTLYKYVQSHYNITDNVKTDRHDLKYSMNQTEIEDVTATLILTSFLRGIGLKADVLLLSDKRTELLNPIFPDMQEVKHVVCLLDIFGTKHLLDPSDKNLSFGILPYNYYNGFAWALNEKGGYAVDMSADSLLNIDKVYVDVKPDSSDNSKLVYNIKKTYGKVSAYYNRKKWKDDVNDLKKEVMEDVENHNGSYVIHTVSDLNNVEEPLMLQYSYTRKLWEDDLLFVPAEYESMLPQNPFPKTKRQHPIHLPHRDETTYYYTFQFPKSYVVDELPKPFAYALGEGKVLQAAANYAFDKSKNTYKAFGKISVNATDFDPVAYDDIRAFYEKIIEESNKTITIKKVEN